jgi:FtsZ-interacting cell division protein ZipA
MIKEAMSAPEPAAPEEKTLVVSHTAAKKLKAKQPRSEAQLAATAKLVEATRLRREERKKQLAEEHEAKVKAEEERIRKEQEEAVAKAKIVVKPKRKYTKKEKKVPEQPESEESEEESESDEEEEDPKPKKAVPKKVSSTIRRVKEAIDSIDRTIEAATSNQYESLLRRKGYLP